MSIEEKSYSRSKRTAKEKSDAGKVEFGKIDKFITFYHSVKTQHNPGGVHFKIRRLGLKFFSAVDDEIQKFFQRFQQR